MPRVRSMWYEVIRKLVALLAFARVATSVYVSATLSAEMTSVVWTSLSEADFTLRESRDLPLRPHRGMLERSACISDVSKVNYVDDLARRHLASPPLTAITRSRPTPTTCRMSETRPASGSARFERQFTGCERVLLGAESIRRHAAVAFSSIHNFFVCAILLLVYFCQRLCRSRLYR